MWTLADSNVRLSDTTYFWDGTSPVVASAPSFGPLRASMITQTIQSLLRADARLMPVLYIERSPLLNEDPSKTPWLGIYRNKSAFKARTLGYGPGARYQSTTVVIVLQVANLQDGDACEDEMEEYLANVLSVILTNPTLNGLVSTLSLANIMYRMVQVQDDTFFQQAEIYLTVETTTR